MKYLGWWLDRDRTLVLLWRKANGGVWTVRFAPP